MLFPLALGRTDFNLLAAGCKWGLCSGRDLCGVGQAAGPAAVGQLRSIASKGDLKAPCEEGRGREQLPVPLTFPGTQAVRADVAQDLLRARGCVAALQLKHFSLFCLFILSSVALAACV